MICCNLIAFQILFIAHVSLIVNGIIDKPNWSEQIPYISISELKSEYDYIVIGAGASGSVVATRLSMHESHPSVLLIEAGDKANVSPESFEMLPPFSFNSQLTSIDWAFKTTSQTNCCSGLFDNQGRWPRGKVMGGSAVLNTMFYVYGNPNDWDTLMNIDGWNSTEILPFYHKIENYHSFPYNNNNHNNDNRGHSGPIEVNEVRNLVNTDQSILIDRFIQSCIAFGYPFINDINDWNKDNSVNPNPNKIGCHYAQNNIEFTSGLRINSFVAYLRYLVNSNEYKNGDINLHILPNSHVTKITFTKDKDKSTVLTANGIEFTNDNNEQPYFVGLKRDSNSEIILSAGAIGSPQLLMLSGIGPNAELKKHNIPIIQDLPGVGRNLQDHVFVINRFFLNEEYYDKTVTSRSIGVNMKTSTLEANVFINTVNGIAAEIPDIKLHFLRVGLMNAMYFNYKNDYKCANDTYFQDLENVQAFIVSLILEHPKSRGYIRLASANPMDYPIINPRYLSDESDLDVLVNGYEHLMQMMDEMKDVWVDKSQCFDNNNEYDNNHESLKDWIRATVTTQYHPIGTCKMGNDDDSDLYTVVNQKLKLKNTNNVRIADASILPNIITGNPQATCYMIGEKAAHFIINEITKGKNCNVV